MTGKYDKIMAMGVTYETTSNAFREAIANELAEQNRLKRWELKRKYPQTTSVMIGNDPSTQKIFEEYPKDDLEDKA